MVLVSANLTSGWSSSGGFNTAKNGWKITVGSSVISLISVNKEASANQSKAYVYNSAKDTQIGTTATFSGNTATFSTGINLSANTTYYILVDSAGADNRPARFASCTFSDVFTNLSIIAGVDNSAGIDAAQVWGIESINIDADVVSTVVGTGTAGSRFLKTDWDALTASDSTKAIGVFVKNLVPEKSLVPARYKVGIN